jgi:hypothetical protein
MFCLERTQLRVLRIDCPEDPLRPEEVGRRGGSRVKAVREVSDSEFAREMARREIVYQRPTPYWQNGLSIGNGDVGGSVFGGGPESGGLIGIALNKVDVWDERYDRKGHHVHTLAELRALVAEHAGTEEGRKHLNSLEPYGLVAEPGWFQRTYPYPYSPPTCKPTGVVRIDPGAAFERFESRLSIHRGEVTFTLGDGDKGAEVAASIDANSNTLALRVDRRGDFDRPISFQMARYVDEQLGRPEVGAEGNSFWHRYVFPDGFTYALFGIVSKGELASRDTSEADWTDTQPMTAWVGGGRMRNWEVEIKGKEHRATLTLCGESSSATVFVGVATSKEAHDPLGRAQELASAAASLGYDSVRSSHRKWWDGFWRKSSLLLSDRLAEALWYQGLYLLACQSRGAGPPPIIGPGYQLPHGGWHGALITDYNVEMMYWPIFTANHLELGRPFFDFFRRNLDKMKAETRAVYGIDGVRFPCITNHTCEELSYLPCRNWQCVSAWLAQIYWWGYVYTGDLEFLRRTAYPVMREVANFYRGYALLGDDGRYHIFPSTPPEQPPWWATDPAIDIALIRVHMQATLEASQLLGLDAGLRGEWRHLLEHLAEIPTNDDVFLDHRDASADSRLGHTGLLCATWTAGLIGLASPPDQYEMAVRTFHTLPARTSRSVQDYPFDIPTWNDDCCWPNMIGYAARLGLAEEAAKYLYDFGIFQHLKPNGLFAFDAPRPPVGGHPDDQRQTHWGMPDSNYAMTAVVSEMLLQSYDGVIRVAPACPADWDARFSGFLAAGARQPDAGAFEVDAEVTHGSVRALQVRSLKGGRCRVYNPWPGQTVAVTCAGKPVDFQESGRVLSFETQPGSDYEVKQVGPGARAAILSGGNTYSSPEEQPSGPICYRGPGYMGQVPEEKRLAVWLGLPGRPTRAPASSQARVKRAGCLPTSSCF